ncbi:tumor necrosis factor receptor superfamily member 18 isoform X1 [Ictalurus punctatus]|uniref:Tumor necrosis factor receptor superfamily member 18 isoform X1 n=1 Tax=Ictalurus punctatus TaxID=7998 RepID=A0A2D0RXJ9_ICTPU|nr:tumor necrosis factor receptor superfamily member 18 isoform X1 [Ictalurus punctatus]
MDKVKPYVILFATGCVLSMCMALDCNWKTQYEYKGRCCKTCPSGEFPKQHCSENSPSVCEKCKGKSDHCFCNNALCENVDCSKCSTNPQCKQGEELKRTGSFKFGYNCGVCTNQTYYSEKDKMCKPIKDCSEIGMLVIFRGNRTHNALCGYQVSYPNDLVTHIGVVMGLVITGLACLAILIYLCIQRTREPRTKKKYPPTSSSLNVPFEECGCKLSKEEIGEV